MSLTGATTYEPRVLLITTIHLPSTARLAMALARNGCKVFAITPPNHPLRLIQAASAIFPYRVFRSLSALETVVKDISPDLLIPCDETAVRHLHQLYRVSARPATCRLIERSLGNAENYQIVEARRDLLIAASDAGINVPASRGISSVEDLQAWSLENPFPWVLKADGTCAGLGVRIVSTMQDAEATFHELVHPLSAGRMLNKLLIDREPFWVRYWWAGTRPTISVQSYIVGRPANCSVACWQGEVLAGITLEVVVAESRTGPSTVNRIVDNPEMMDTARRLVRKLGLSGLIGFDFMIETATGAARLIEMNPRNTPVCHINLGPGHDLVGALTAALSGREKPNNVAVTSNDIIALFPDAWMADSESRFLYTGYHDVPWEEPALINELLKPKVRDRLWITRQVRKLRGYRQNLPLTFPESLPAWSSPWQLNRRRLDMQDMD
jgi:ATP-grasp domain